VADGSRRLVFESHFEIGLTSTMVFDLAADGKQTQLTATVDYAFTGRGLGRFVGGLFGNQMARKDILAGLEHLKAQLEAEAGRPARRRRRAAPKR
jgi:hypothetical protein